MVSYDSLGYDVTENFLLKYLQNLYDKIIVNELKFCNDNKPNNISVQGYKSVSN